MQTLDWYYRRLKAMSAAEIALRIGSLLRDRADWFLVGRRQQLRRPSAILDGDGRDEGPAFRVSDMTVGNRARLKTDDEIEKQSYDSLLARADRIAEHRLDFFNLKDKHLGDPIVWNRDRERGQDTPMT